jgi:guanosine-3',5'-bis(diphosphate) 3'-pyrophosphohydrolase
VTDEKCLPKDRRKRLQEEHASYLPPRAKMLKMADKISNLSALPNSPPTGWPAQRRTEYFEWAREVVERCPSAHAGRVGLLDELSRRSEQISR